MKVLKWLLIILVALLLLAFGASFVMPPAEYTTEFTADKPVARTWEVMTDPERAGEWMQGLRSMRTLEGEPLTVGSRHELLFIEQGREYPMIEVVTSVAEHEHMSFSLTHEIMESDVTIRFEDLGERTRVVTENLVRGKSFAMRLMMPLMTGEMKRRQDVGYGILKGMIEEDEAQGDAAAPAPEQE